MPLSQVIAGIALVVILLAFAVYSAWRQLQVLKAAPAEEDESPEDRAYRRHKAWRRLIAAGLMVLLAALLAGAMLYLEAPAQEIADEGPEALERPEDRAFFKLYGYYWIVVLVALLALVLIAGYDFWSVRRHGLRQWRQLQDDRRAMIERESAEFRRRRGEW